MTAVRLARREVHLKSTHGRPSAGLAKLTAFVVDELGLARLPSDAAGWAELAAPRPFTRAEMDAARDGALEDDARVLEDDGSTERIKPFTRKEVLRMLGRFFFGRR